MTAVIIPKAPPAWVIATLAVNWPVARTANVAVRKVKSAMNEMFVRNAPTLQRRSIMY